MNPGDTAKWSDANQRYLMASLRAVREELEFYRDSLRAETHDENAFYVRSPEAREELEKAAGSLPALSTLDTLVDILGLSTFECKILLMCAGVELDAQFSSLIADLQGGASLVHPSFSLALAAFPDAHWSAISTSAPLRYWRLIEINQDKLITKNPLRIDEYILHYLAGVSYLDEKLQEILDPVFPNNPLAPSQAELARDIGRACSSKAGYSRLPAVQLNGAEKADKKAVAALACAGIGLQLYAFYTYSLPENPKELAGLLRLWNRQAALTSCALFLDSASLDANDKQRVQALLHFIEQVRGILILSNDGWMPALKRPVIEFEVGKPAFEEQLYLWKKCLGEAAADLDNQLQHVVSHFNFSAGTIDSASMEVLAHRVDNDKGQKKIAPANLEEKLWEACCIHTRPKVDELAQRIEPAADWDDIVLPEIQKQTLREIAQQVRHRRKVYHEWGFAGKGPRGLGISALFSGESGTGKTMASEVLANELKLDLYRIDLSQVVNKYIGETEKNLKRIFDAAEEGGAILLFDEADALFGKRSDVKDSHDRYSNIEVSYLLQRMEAYCGLAVLTTNMRSAIDKAFLRRIRFIVQFPYPDARLRAEIWKRAFPANTPVEGLDIEKLARLNVPGGHIRNIALNAAFIAAGEGQPVQMPHLLRAARTEYSKLEKALSNNEIRGWQ